MTTQPDEDIEQDILVERSHGVEFEENENVDRILGRGHEPLPGYYPPGLRQGARRILHDDTTARVLHEDAIQVRQITPLNAVTMQISVPNTVAVQVAWLRRERLHMLITNTGSTAVYLGTSQAAAGSGFPLAGGQTVEIFGSSEWWALSATGSVIVGVLDEYRGDIETGS